MKLVVFGLTISSSWGNGHATLWRALCRALVASKHQFVFFEKDVEYYRRARDVTRLDGAELVLYSDFAQVRALAERHVSESDAALVTSYCPDGPAACRLVLDRARGVRVFYDLDTPVTLAAIEAGSLPPYVCKEGLSDFDLVLSFTGGRALELLRRRLGARSVAPLYGHVDPEAHRPVPREARYASALSYLGTYAEDREAGLEQLFLTPARSRPGHVFALAGSQYPARAYPANVVQHEHVAPSDHSAFHCSSRMVLNLTRGTMARFGFCPSGRLFEAAACGAPIVSDWFEGLDEFFAPGSEIAVARSSQDVLCALEESDRTIHERAAAARARVLERHTAVFRAEQLLNLLSAVGASAARRGRPHEEAILDTALAGAPPHS